MDNEPQVLVKPLPFSTLASICAFYRGPRNDPQGKSDLSHRYEHMVFEEGGRDGWTDARLC